tara:strand:+ start:211 stop:537 length:327 start_codon:yes stop_codon:yes gene_type:complete
MTIRDYLNKYYIQSLFIGVISTVIYKLQQRTNKESTNTVPTSMKLLELLKVFLASSLGSIIVLYTLHYVLSSKKLSGGGEKMPTIQTQPAVANISTLQQPIMTGKPTF